MNKPKPESVLSMDVGHKRIGLARCDPLGITISRLPPIHRKDYEQDLKAISRLCLIRKVKGLVIGLPLNENGLLTKQAKYSQDYGNKVAISLSLPIAFVNEHSSSWFAADKYNLVNDRSGRLDCAVAGLLLEQWLREGPMLKPVQMPS